MQTRRLGSSDMDITAVGFGMGAIAWLDDSSWIRARGDAQGALRRALELGVNWIDAALWGHSIEHSAARVIEGWPGEKPYVFTRCVRYRSTREGLEVSVPFDAVGIRRACEDSLRDLQPHAIDLYVADLPPGLDPDWSSNAWWTMAQLQREGKVRWIGLGDCD
ncbi:MAG TPA: aldo/keto reductase, partial [Longimicrobium sp.]|nr:aldo/keto reductase [Longimicrobium sp.]